MRFDLIDRVLDHDRDPPTLTAIKNVTAAEEYLQDHFPGFPVLPGVMMLETLVQAGRRLATLEGRRPPTPLVLGETRNVRYAAMVRPGQSLRVAVTLRGVDGEDLAFQGKGTVEDRVAVQARFTLRPLSKVEGRKSNAPSPEP